MPEKNIALIGAGYWGKNLVRNFHQLGVLKTICDQSSAIRQQMAKDYPDTTVTDDFNALLSDSDIQAVVISAPAAQHHALATQALDAGKHCFVEKPLSLTYDEGAALVRLAESKKKILFVGHILQYHPAVVRLKELINKGTIGRLQYIYSRRLSLGKIRREENILWSFAPHDISIILSLAVEEPSYVDSVGSNFLHARIADVTMTNLKFPSGIGELWRKCSQGTNSDKGNRWVERILTLRQTCRLRSLKTYPILVDAARCYFRTRTRYILGHPNWVPCDGLL